MAREFIATTTGILGRIGSTERRILQNFFTSLIELLEDSPAPSDPLAALVGWDDSVTAPQSPVLKRLLPDGVKDDDAAALELRRLTERSVRQSKVGALKAAAMLLDSERLRLDAEQAETFARALNDARLALSAQLEISSPGDHDRLRQELRDSAGKTSPDTETEVRLATTSLYEFTGALQQAVLEALEDFWERETQ